MEANRTERDLFRRVFSAEIAAHFAQLGVLTSRTNRIDYPAKTHLCPAITRVAVVVQRSALIPS